MKYFLSLVCLMLLLSCNKGFDGNLEQLPGYWEIQKVVVEGKTIREYRTNAVVDFIELNSDSTGVRKKLAPRLDGTFAKTQSSEHFSIRYEDSRCFLDYKTPYDSWSEEIIALEEGVLITTNEDGLVYYYFRFEPQNFLINE